MKFGRYLVEKSRPEWRDEYIDYKQLKDLIKEAQSLDEGEASLDQSRITSLTVKRANEGRQEAEERFFQVLDEQVAKVGAFTDRLVGGLRERLAKLQAASAALQEDEDRQSKESRGGTGGAKTEAAGASSSSDSSSASASASSRREALLAEAQAVGDEFLALEKYVNLNYLGFHKILKKHDKALPTTPCRQYYVALVHQQPWVQGNYSDLLVLLSSIYSRLRGDSTRPATASSAREAARAAAKQRVRATRFWVRTEDVSAVKHFVLQHLPVWVPPEAPGSDAEEVERREALAERAVGDAESRGERELAAGEAARRVAAEAIAEVRPAEDALEASLAGGAGPSSDTRAVSCVYLDNSALSTYHARLARRPDVSSVRLRWEGDDDAPAAVAVQRQVIRDVAHGMVTEEASFTLPAKSVGRFLAGGLSAEAAADLAAAGLGDAARRAALDAAKAVLRDIDAKQLRPALKTTFDRTEFRMPYDDRVAVALDVGIVAAKEQTPEEAVLPLEAELNAAGNSGGGSGSGTAAAAAAASGGAHAPPGSSASGLTPASSSSEGPGLRWLRDSSVPLSRSEVTRFPHAVLELSLAPDVADSPPTWVAELLASDKLTEVAGFSKYVHGVAALYPDVVQAVPYWVDDETVRPSVLASAPERAAPARPGARDLKVADVPKPRTAQRAGFLESILPAALGGRKKKTRGRGGGAGSGRGGAAASATASAAASASASTASIPMPRHPLLGDAPTLRLLPPPQGRDSGADEEGGSNALLDWWFAKPPQRAPPPPRSAGGQAIGAAAGAGRPEPKTHLANERTFLSWLHMAVTVGSISAALLGFSASSSSSKSGEGEERDPMQLVAIILLPVAVLICGYALLLFVWRSDQLRGRAAGYIDDRRGPLALSGVIIGALSIIFLISLWDFVSAFFEPPTASPSPAPAADPTALPPAQAPLGEATEQLATDTIQATGKLFRTGLAAAGGRVRNYIALGGTTATH